MTGVLSVRVPRRNLDAIDRHAAAAGVDRSTLINRILEEALAGCPPLPRRRFASAHLIGKYPAGRGSTNDAIRAAFRTRPRETNR